MKHPESHLEFQRTILETVSKIERSEEELLAEFPYFNLLPEKISPDVLISVVKKLLKILPYLEVLDPRNSPLSIEGIINGTSQSRTAETLVKAALNWTQLALAQEALSAGHLILPLLYDDLKSASNFCPDEFPDPNCSLGNPAQNAACVLEGQELLKKNLALFMLKIAFDQDGSKLFTYDIARSVSKDSFFLEHSMPGFHFTWNQKCGFAQDKIAHSFATKGWVMDIGYEKVPLPLPSDLVAGELQFGSYFSKIQYLKTILEEWLSEILTQKHLNETEISILQKVTISS